GHTECTETSKYSGDPPGVSFSTDARKACTVAFRTSASDSLSSTYKTRNGSSHAPGAAPNDGDDAAEPMERRRFLGHVQVRVPATQPSQQCTQREEAAHEGFAARTCSRAR